MVGLLIRLIIVAAGLWVASEIVPGFHIASLESLVLAGVVLGLVNAIVRPVMTVLTFPITLITLGLFLLVINGLMVELMAFLLRHHGVYLRGFVSALLVAIVTGLVSWAASWFIGSSGRVEAMRR